MVEETILPINYIVSAPGSMGGRPRVAGRRISVEDVAHLHVWLGVPLDEIVQIYELTHAQIYAALSYYYDHKAEIDAELSEDINISRAQTQTDHYRDMREKAYQRAEERRQQEEPEAEMTVPEIAQEFGVREQTIREAAKAGWIRARKSGATWLIRRSDATARWGHHRGASR